MSYILDALKKAERERGLTRVPTVMTVHDLRRVRRNGRAIAAGALLLCAAALAWFFLRPQSDLRRPPDSVATGAAQNRPPERPDELRGNDISSAAVSVPERPSEAPAQPAHPKSAAVAGKLEPAPVPVTTASPKNQVEPASQRPARNVPERRQREGQPVGSERAPAPAAVDNVQSQPGARTEIPAPKEPLPLPRPAENQAALRDAMAKMTLNILVFEEAESQRKAYINGKKYVKGDRVDGLYLVESITMDGVVLSYNGERALLRPR